MGVAKCIKNFVPTLVTLHHLPITIVPLVWIPIQDLNDAILFTKNVAFTNTPMFIFYYAQTAYLCYTCKKHIIIQNVKAQCNSKW